MDIQIGDIVRVGGRSGYWVVLKSVPAPNQAWRVRQEAGYDRAATVVVTGDVDRVLRPTIEVGDQLSLAGRHALTVLQVTQELIDLALAPADQREQISRGSTVNHGPSKIQVPRGTVVAENIKQLIGQTEGD